MKSTEAKQHGDIRFLRAMASRLDEGEPPLTAKERSLLRLTLRRMLARSEAQLKQIDAAYRYRLLLEIEGKRRWKAHRDSVAEHYGYTKQAVSDFASEWRPEIEGRLARLSQNIEYEGLTRVEMLTRELKSM
jgi:hypothetical protein